MQKHSLIELINYKIIYKQMITKVNEFREYLKETLKTYEIDIVTKKLQNLFIKYNLKQKKIVDIDKKKYYVIHSNRDLLKQDIDNYKNKKHFITKGMIKLGYKQEDLIESAVEKLNNFKYGDIFIFTDYNTPELTIELLNLINTSGYFVASINKELNITDKNKIKEKLSTTNNISISIEPNFDTKMDFNGEFLYHTTDKKNLQKIMKIGLIPKSKNTRSFYPERIYLAPNLEYLDSIEKQLNIDNENEYVKLKIKNINKLNLYKDVRFNGGYYTYDNIAPSNIEIINNI